MITIKTVNKEIKKLGLELVAGNGYLYFWPTNTPEGERRTFFVDVTDPRPPLEDILTIEYLSPLAKLL